MIFRFLILALIVSCQDGGGGSGGSSFAIPDQTLQGSINGKTFSFIEGSYEVNSQDAEKIDITLYAEDVADVCNPTTSASRFKVFFTIKDMVQETSLSFGGDNNQTITMYDYADGDNQNFIATSGLISITSTNGSSVAGGINMEEVSGAKVSGKFTITKCN